MGKTYKVVDTLFTDRDAPLHKQASPPPSTWPHPLQGARLACSR